MYGGNVIAIRTNTNWLKWFKNGDFERWQSAPNVLQLWKKTNCEKER